MMLLPIFELAGEGQARYTVTLGANQLARAPEPQDQIVHAMIVHQIHDRAAAADNQQSVILFQILLNLIKLLVVRLHLANKGGRAPIRAIREHLLEADRFIQAWRLVNRLHFLRNFLRCD